MSKSADIRRELLDLPLTKYGVVPYGLVAYLARKYRVTHALIRQIEETLGLETLSHRQTNKLHAYSVCLSEFLPLANPLGPRHHVKAHGTYSGYHAGCRCEPCRAADRLYQREYRRIQREKRE